jgi:hypothetical protein
MTENTSKESKSYRDPLGTHMHAVKSVWQDYKNRFPPVASVYDGFYITVKPAIGNSASPVEVAAKSSNDTMPDDAAKASTTAKLDGSALAVEKCNDIAKSPVTAKPNTAHAFFLGAEGIIGTTVQIDGSFVRATDGRVVACLNNDDNKRIDAHKKSGWQVIVVLALILYHNETKSPSAQLACICYSPELRDSLGLFAKNMLFRIRKGEHPSLALTQEQFIRVLESKGSWYLTKGEPLPALPKGTIVYKKRRVWSENLVEQALRGNIGCKIANVFFWLVLAAAITFAIWWFFLK